MYGSTTMHQARLTAEQKMRGKTSQDEIFADRGSGRRQGRPGRFVFGSSIAHNHRQWSRWQVRDQRF